MYQSKDRNFELAFEGEIIKSITGIESGSDLVVIITESGKKFIMAHEQDCCEHVAVHESLGNVADIIGEPIVYTKQVVEELEDASESGTKTTFIITTNKGTLNIIWHGESNGYYSESVSFIQENFGQQ